MIIQQHYLKYKIINNGYQYFLQTIMIFYAQLTKRNKN